MPVLTRNQERRLANAIVGPTTRSRSALLTKYSDEDMNVAETLLTLKRTIVVEETSSECIAQQRPRRAGVQYARN